MSELKISIDLSDRTYDMLSNLASALKDNLINTLANNGNFQEFAEASKKLESKQNVKATKAIEVKEVAKEEKSVDYEKLRAEIRTIASTKKVAGKDVKAVLKSFGGKLSEVANDKLEALRDEMEAL